MNTDINWDDLKFFLALAKHGKLQHAAKSLNSNHTTVYRRIKSFEDYTQKKLFNSTPSGYVLTNIGEKLLEEISELEERMDKVNRFIDGIDDSIQGRVSFTTTSSLAMTVLPKVLATFKRESPELCIDLKVSTNFFNLSKREADIAIRPCINPPEHLIGRKLGRLHFALYASSQYIKNNKINKSIMSNLSGHDILSLDENFSHLLSKQWFDKFIENLPNVYHADDLTTLAHLCSQGLGLALLPTYFTKSFPNLKMIHKPKDFIGSDLWLLTHKDISKTPKIKFCMELLSKELTRELF